MEQCSVGRKINLEEGFKSLRTNIDYNTQILHPEMLSPAKTEKSQPPFATPGIRLVMLWRGPQVLYL